MIKVFRMIAIGVLAGLAGISSGHAAGGKAKKLEHQHWHFLGLSGNTTRMLCSGVFRFMKPSARAAMDLSCCRSETSVKRAGPFYLESCPAGIPESVDCANPNDNPVVKAIAENYKFQITDGPDDTGDMFDRPAVPSDHFPGPFANETIARLANNNALPPDLSLMAKARHGGPDYIYSLLVGYEDAPSTIEIAPGQYYNPYFHVICLRR